MNDSLLIPKDSKSIKKHSEILNVSLLLSCSECNGYQTVTSLAHKDDMETVACLHIQQVLYEAPAPGGNNSLISC